MKYKEDLDKLACARGHKVKGVWLHGKCHLGVGTYGRYENGVLVITCAVCGSLVVEVAVASKILKGG